MSWLLEGPSSEDMVEDLLLGLGLTMLLLLGQQSGEEQLVILDCLEFEIEEVATAMDSHSTDIVEDLTGLDLVTMESPGLTSRSTVVVVAAVAAAAMVEDLESLSLFATAPFLLCSRNWVLSASLSPSGAGGIVEDSSDQ